MYECISVFHLSDSGVIMYECMSECVSVCIGMSVSVYIYV